MRHWVLDPSPARQSSEVPRSSHPTNECDEIATETDRGFPARRMSHVFVDEELSTADRACELVLHVRGNQGVGVAPDEKGGRPDVGELGHVVVLEKPRESLLPDTCRNLEQLLHEQVDNLSRELWR